MAGGDEEERGTPMEEALELSKPGLSAADAAGGLDFEGDDDDDFYDDDDDLDDGPIRTGTSKKRKQPSVQEIMNAPDPDLADLNNPDLLHLGDAPMLGSRGRTEMFGEVADTFGRPTSPKLYASAGQFPNCVQFRVWRMENGIPVGLGAIDSEATEEDFVRAYFSAMPKPGEGRFQFRMRPIDQRGAELGKEFIVNISEHHSALKQLRETERRQREEQMMGGGGWGRGPGGDVIVQGGGHDAAAASMAEEMGRMFETAVERAEDQTKHLQATLEMERERLREEERQRAAERVSLAERASQTTEKMMERLMGSDRQRSEEAMKAQRQHSDLLMTTLTTVFQQQQQAAREQAERMREQDAIRLQQDREYFERQRQEAEERRRTEREEYERKRQYELEQMRIEAQKKRRRSSPGGNWRRRKPACAWSARRWRWRRAARSSVRSASALGRKPRSVVSATSWSSSASSPWSARNVNAVSEPTESGGSASVPRLSASATRSVASGSAVSSCVARRCSAKRSVVGKTSPCR